MKKRTISVFVALVMVVSVFVTVICLAFPERFFVSQGANGIEKVNVLWSPGRSKRTIPVTDSVDIQSFCKALRYTESLSCNMFVDHNEGLYFDPQYKLEITYKNGKRVKLISSEGGGSMIRFVDPQADHGEHSYFIAKNEALLDWVKSVAFSGTV